MIRSLIALAITAQVMLPHRGGGGSSSSSSFTPESIGTIRYYWLSSDLVTNVTVTNWTDRIHGLVASESNAALRPTNVAGLGVHFAGTEQIGTFATNFDWQVNNVAQTGSVFIVFTPVTPSSTLNGLSVSSDTHGLYTKSSGVFAYFGDLGSANPFGSFSSGTTMDMTLAVQPGTLSILTNGVACTSGNLGMGVQQAAFGGDTLGHFKGYLAEISWYSNTLSSPQISQLHQYATNRYGYSP